MSERGPRLHETVAIYPLLVLVAILGFLHFGLTQFPIARTPPAALLAQAAGAQGSSALNKQCSKGSQYDYTCPVGQKSTYPEKICMQGKKVADTSIRGHCEKAGEARDDQYKDASGNWIDVDKKAQAPQAASGLGIAPAQLAPSPIDAFGGNLKTGMLGNQQSLDAAFGGSGNANAVNGAPLELDEVTVSGAAPANSTIGEASINGNALGSQPYTISAAADETPPPQTTSPMPADPYLTGSDTFGDRFSGQPQPPVGPPSWYWDQYDALNSINPSVYNFEPQQPWDATLDQRFENPNWQSYPTPEWLTNDLLTQSFPNDLPRFVDPNSVQDFNFNAAPSWLTPQLANEFTTPYDPFTPVGYQGPGNWDPTYQRFSGNSTPFEQAETLIANAAPGGIANNPDFPLSQNIEDRRDNPISDLEAESRRQAYRTMYGDNPFENPNYWQGHYDSVGVQRPLDPVVGPIGQVVVGLSQTWQTTNNWLAANVLKPVDDFLSPISKWPELIFGK